MPRLRRVNIDPVRSVYLFFMSSRPIIARAPPIWTRSAWLSPYAQCHRIPNIVFRLFFKTVFYHCFFFLRNFIINTQTNTTNRMSTEQRLYPWKGVLEKNFNFHLKTTKTIMSLNVRIYPRLYRNGTNTYIIACVFSVNKPVKSIITYTLCLLVI